VRRALGAKLLSFALAGFTSEVCRLSVGSREPQGRQMARTPPMDSNKAGAYTPRRELKLFGVVSVGNTLLIAMSLICVIPPIAIAIWAYKFFGPQGITEQKAIAGKIQGIEWEYRYKNLATPFLLTATAAGYPLRLVALPTNDRHFPYLWLELSLQWQLDETKDQFFEIGTAKPIVSCAAVRKLLDTEKVTLAAQRFLQDNCQS
jgi:hypothetical protein